jgi:general secretion pathway protein B
VLDTGTRSSLPALKLSMHVFNNEPARRFAIIDGQRVTEGAQLGSATVVEIRRDGVVLDVGGRRVLIPRP